METLQLGAGVIAAIPHMHSIQAQAISESGTYALAILHQNTFASILSQVGRTYCPLASQSRDGDYVAFVMSRLRFFPIRGSSSRGGQAARLQIIHALNSGVSAAVTVDGPKGPRGEVKPGIIEIARAAGVAILPMAVVAERYWIFRRSWDQFRLPKPFSRIAVRYGTPTLIPDGINVEAFDAARRDLASALHALDAKACRDFQEPRTAALVTGASGRA